MFYYANERNECSTLSYIISVTGVAYNSTLRYQAFIRVAAAAAGAVKMAAFSSDNIYW